MAVGLWRTIDLAPKCRPARFPVGAASSPRRAGFLWARRPRREERAPCGRGVLAAKNGLPVGAASAPRRAGSLWARRPRREERASCGSGVRAAKSGLPVGAASAPRRTGFLVGAASAPRRAGFLWERRPRREERAFLWARRPRREERAPCGRGVLAAKNGFPVGAASAPRRICAERSACSPYPVHSPAWFFARKERHRFNTSGKLRMSTHFFNPRPAAKALHTCRRAHA
jgi:hypothetical protein